MHRISGNYTPTVLRFAAALFFVSAAIAPAQSLIRVGEECRYYKAYYTRLLAPPGWQLVGFNDSRWESAPTGYVFDDPQLRIRLRSGAHPGYGYVRKTFQVTNVAQIKSLILRVEFERAFVAYLNGVEVGRFPKAGAVRDAIQADVSRGFPSSPDGQFDISNYISLLKEGENLLAAEGPFSNEGSIAVPITPALLVNFIRGPFIQNATTNSIQVIWRTWLAGDSLVEYGTSSNLDLRRRDARPVTEHVLTLTNLSSGQKYFYRVRTELPSGVINSEMESFKPMKTSGAIRFMVLGDSGQGTTAQTKIARVIREADPDFVLHCGDLVYQGINDRSVDWRFFNYYQAHMRTTPYYMVVGNHDLNCCFGDGEPDYNPTNWVLNATSFQRAFFLPTNNVTGTKHFYSFDAGDAHFVALYNPWFADYNFTAQSDQFGWLTNDLALSSKPWKFIFMHMPLATSGGHYNRDDNANFINDSTELMNLLLPVATRYGVQLVMGGHDHNFERFAPTNGIHHFVTGGGGGSVYEMKQRHPASAQFWATNHCVRVSVSGETALVEALDLKGAVFDQFTIHRALAQDQVFESTWHAPKMATSRFTDGDGNIPGQIFDFAGGPLVTRAGQWSNLGHVYVNNDDSHLFIGFDSVMIYPDSTIVLFIESPGLPGVTNLTGLGNGIVDPWREGTDGLDFLENVSFTNFAPSIACLLGDEFADGQYRDFRRFGARVNTGQGVFRLDRSFTSVAGIRLQQFNRSPQIDIARDESNSDFIQLAIPFKSLGNIRPGDMVKLAAVVAGGDIHPDSQTAPIDTSALATFISGSGHEKVALSGVRVRLAKPK